MLNPSPGCHQGRSLRQFWQSHCCRFPLNGLFIWISIRGIIQSRQLYAQFSEPASSSLMWSWQWPRLEKKSEWNCQQSCSICKYFSRTLLPLLLHVSWKISHPICLAPGSERTVLMETFIGNTVFPSFRMLCCIHLDWHESSVIIFGFQPFPSFQCVSSSSGGHHSAIFIFQPSLGMIYS